MAISIIRTATSEDRQRVNAAVRRFCERHDILITNVDAHVFGDELEGVIDFHIVYGISDPKEQTALRIKLAQAMCRALRVKYDRRIVLAFGNVGISID